MWYGVLGGKELLHQTYKNLEQRVQLECDGKRIPLPSLQGIVVLNINRLVLSDLFVYLDSLKIISRIFLLYKYLNVV